MDAEYFAKADVACYKERDAEWSGWRSFEGHEGDDGGDGDENDGENDGDGDEVMRRLITGTLATLPLTDRQEMCANHSYVRERAYFAFSELKTFLTLNIHTCSWHSEGI